MTYFSFNKTHFRNPSPQKNYLLKNLGGIILAFFNITIFGKYFLGFWLGLSSQLPRMFNYRVSPPGFTT